MNADIDRIQIGAVASCEFVLDEEQVQAFAQLSHDVNSLHMDTAAASQLGFPHRVAHGMLALSAISRLIGTELPGHGSLWLSHEAQFPNPVFVGNRLSASVTVEQVSKSVNVVVLRTEAVNLTTGTTVLRGSARVRVPSRKPGRPR